MDINGLPVQDVDNGIERGGVFAQSLPLVKGEKGDCSRVLVEQGLADDGVVRVLDGFLDWERDADLLVLAHGTSCMAYTPDVRCGPAFSGRSLRVRDILLAAPIPVVNADSLSHGACHLTTDIEQK